MLRLTVVSQRCNGYTITTFRGRSYPYKPFLLYFFDSGILAGFIAGVAAQAHGIIFRLALMPMVTVGSTCLCDKLGDNYACGAAMVCAAG